MKQVSLVIPAYNEEGAIRRVLGEYRTLLHEHGYDAEIIVVDDGSTDRTASEAVAAGARVLRHRSNHGYGAALKTGITAATHNFIAITDADGTYPARYLPQLFEMLEHSDMIVGARTGNTVRIPLIRRPAKFVLAKLARYVSQGDIKDLNSGMRAFRRDLVMQYFSILPDQFSWTSTITIAMHCDKYAVRYLPIDYLARTGRSKIVPWDAASFAVLILRTAMLFRPLRVFIPLVLACFAVGLCKTLYDFGVKHDRMISISSLLLMLSGLLILLIGMVGDAIATRLGRLNTSLSVHARAEEMSPMTPFQPGDSGAA